MNKTQKIIAVAITVTAVAAWFKFAPNKTAQYFAERYPNHDPKLVMAAHDKLMGLAFRGKLDMANWSEEKYNGMLLQTIAQMQTEK